MTLPATKHPVELLRDGKGVYGIGAVDEVEIDHRSRNLILRSDRLSEYETRFSGYPILQKISGGFRHGMFCHTSEEQLRRVIHHRMLHRAGLAWPPEEPLRYYWSSDTRQQIRNRQIYHGLRLGSLSIINRLIGQALEEAANQDAVRIARRFIFVYRYSIYCATAQSPRALQLAVTFPVLAFAIFAKRSPIHYEPRSFDELLKANAERGRICQEAAARIEAGAPLRKIADLMSVPMALRKIKPGAAELALFATDALQDERLVHAYLPDSLPRMRFWLRCINRAERLGPGFVGWIAKHALEIGGSPSEALSFLNDLADWVEACHCASVPSHIFNATIGNRGGNGFLQPRGEQYIVRRFSPDMSLKTVAKLSSDWHEAVANNMSGAEYEFPKPWCDAGQLCGYEIVPISSSGDLYREGHAMHHCVGTKGDSVRRGVAYFYSVRQREERVATLELWRHGSVVEIGELRGSCNSQVSEGIVRVVRQWLRLQRDFHFPKEPEFELVDDDIPF